VSLHAISNNKYKQKEALQAQEQGLIHAISNNKYKQKRSPTSTRARATARYFK